MFGLAWTNCSIPEICCFPSLFSFSEPKKARMFNRDSPQKWLVDMKALNDVHQRVPQYSHAPVWECVCVFVCLLFEGTVFFFCFCVFLKGHQMETSHFGGSPVPFLFFETPISHSHRRCIQLSESRQAVLQRVAGASPQLLDA